MAAELKYVCDERLRLLGLVIRRTNQFAQATRDERQATDIQEFRRLAGLAKLALNLLHIARHQLADHKRQHGCAALETYEMETHQMGPMRQVR